MMEKERKFVSVIIATFNRIDVLGRTLSAFFEQTYPKEHYEIIVVDDGSTEPTVQVIEDLGGKYPSYTLKYHRQDNKGPAAARNEGIKKA